MPKPAAKCASSLYSRIAIHSAFKNRAGTPHFIGIRFPEPRTIRSIAFGRDNSARLLACSAALIRSVCPAAAYSDKCLDTYTIQATQVRNTFSECLHHVISRPGHRFRIRMRTQRMTSGQLWAWSPIQRSIPRNPLSGSISANKTRIIRLLQWRDVALCSLVIGEGNCQTHVLWRCLLVCCADIATS